MAYSSGSEGMSSMNYKGYTARLEFSEGDGVFWGRVLGLPPNTSISFEGETVAQLAQDFHNAVDFYISDCEKSGKSLNQWAANVLQIAAHA